VQTYSGGEEVAWIDAAADGAEPEHPAPTVQLVAAAASGEDATAVTDDGDDGGPDALAVVALVVGALGLVAGVSALVLSRRPRPAA
jgi:hypothetical protein